MKRVFHGFLGGGALMLGALAVVMFVNGGWQALAAAVSVLGGLVLVVSFLSLAAASERPRPARP